VLDSVVEDMIKISMGIDKEKEQKKEAIRLFLSRLKENPIVEDERGDQKAKLHLLIVEKVKSRRLFSEKINYLA
jgi:hypothetical protein